MTTDAEKAKDIIDELNSKIENLERKNENLEAMLDETEAAIEDYKDEVEEYKEENLSLQRIIEELREEIKKLTQTPNIFN